MAETLLGPRFFHHSHSHHSQTHAIYPVAKTILLDYVHCAPSPSHTVFSNPFPTPPVSLPLSKDYLRVANQLCLCLHNSIVKHLDT